MFPRIIQEQSDLSMIGFIDSMRTMEEHYAEIERAWKLLVEGRRLGGAIVEDGRILGSCRMAGVTPGDSGDLGYWLFQEARGRGMVSKCCSALLTVAFEHLKLKTVTIGTAEINERARAVATRLGFQVDRHVPGGLERDGKAWDGVKYLMTAERWTQLNA